MNPFLKNKKDISRGFLTVEILIAVSIITISVLAVAVVAQRSVYLGRQAIHAEEAGYLLEEGAEAVRVSRDNSWANISALTPGTNYYPVFTGGTWTLSSVPSAVGIFVRTISVASVNRGSATEDISATGVNDPGTKLITVSVSWPEGGATIVRTLQFYIADIFS